MDIRSPEERSKNMAAIHSKNTKPEVYFRKLLFAKGYRYSLNSGKVPGHPDIYLRKYNTAIFVHGCFWHRHSGCQYAYMPKTRVEFWQKKFEANVKRDYVVGMELQDKGIKCLIVWECTVKRMKKNLADCEKYLKEIEEFLEENQMFLEI
nr:very short patch repair endonuclease [Lacrimispora amygdalina]